MLRGLILLVVLGVWLAVGAFGGQAQGDLSGLQENDQAAFLPSSAESTRAAEAAEAFDDGASLPAFLVFATAGEGRGELSNDQLAAVESYVEQIPGKDLGAGLSLQEVLDAPVVAVPSEDGRAVLAPISISAERANEVHGEQDEAILDLVVNSIRDSAPGAVEGVGLDAWVGGPAGYAADLVSSFAGIDTVLLLVALIAVLVILFCVYRAPLVPFVVLAAPIFALCASALVVRELASAEVITLNGQAQGIMSILTVGAATDYALLLVARYREELTRTEHPVEAMRIAWRRCVEPVLASAGTVTVGLLCLLFSDLSSNAALGPIGAVAIGSSVLAAMTLLPALLVIAGRRSRGIFWPRRPVLADGDLEDSATSRALWDRVATFVGAHARPAWIITTAGLLVIAGFVVTLRADGTGSSDVFLGDVDSVAADEVLSAHFTAGQGQPVVIITSQDTAEQAREAVAGTDGISGVEVVADDDGEPVVIDGSVQLQAVTEAVAESTEGADTAARVRTAVQEVDPGALVGGASANLLDTNLTAERDLRTIIPAVLAAILVMLILLLRSILAPVLLLIINVLSFAATMGLSAIFFNHVFAFPGADPVVPLFGFIFLVALSIDYSIFLMTRVREEALQVGTRRGTRIGLSVTGGVITSAGLVLAATFSALSVIPLLFMAQLAFIVAVGVLIDTFLVRTVLVPGLVHDVGRRVWWPWQQSYPND